ncbi:MAG: prephenate dehydrogenase [Alphaproteobacteria bacterium]|nr:prephenate dehydrogenase [Alphaproteobacteria bacterium]MCB9984461.1 prephenate dehydrogenase [Micavibrio sp.]HPQ51291.1 prephenate dehydrogenase/arogenate dehydrogenase family protein [Alphaproteobacteria bacterium]HRK97773.1 prephenate dehydrogenase/arogenate dehydrogenase family protein [Alphaproteobacteria bacterium]HRK98587.1 prephenate dehydrogenase/arogenate dehydrogenase family protein [Alphaproteobacteria bacterium]
MRQTLGVMGVGAFGEFMLKYLIPYFEVTVYDSHRDLSDIASLYNVKLGTLDEICDCEIIVLCVPVVHLMDAVSSICHKLQRNQLLIDLCSVKVNPIKIVTDLIPDGVEYLSLHPLFGPQSGKLGIHGLNITLCDIGRTNRKNCIKKYLSETLGLSVHETTPELHDKEMAYVQGLTHMMAKVFSKMDVPEIHQKTKTYLLLSEMVEMIRYDSDELFLAIQRDNPYAKQTKQEFFDAVKHLEEKLSEE